MNLKKNSLKFPTSFSKYFLNIKQPFISKFSIFRKKTSENRKWKTENGKQTMDLEFRKMEMENWKSLILLEIQKVLGEFSVNIDFAISVSERLHRVLH